MNRLLLILTCCWLSLGIQAQKTASIFVSASGKAMPDVEIFLNSSKQTFFTDRDGRAELEIQGEMETAWFFKKGFKYRPDTIRAGKENRVELEAISALLQEVVISDLHASASLTESVLNVRKIDAKVIEAQSAQSVEQSLQHQAILRQSRDNALNTNSLKIMGLGGENVKVLVDGVPMIGRMLGSVDMSELSTNGIAGIELIEGPMSIIYGSNALAGAINIITKSNFSEKIGLQATSNIATDGTYNFGGGFSKKIRKNSIAVQGGRNFFSGWNATGRERGWDWLPKEHLYGNIKLGRRTKKWNMSLSSRVNSSLMLDWGEAIQPYGEVAIDRHYRRDRTDNLLNLRFEPSSKMNFQALAHYNTFKQVKNTYRKDLVNLEETLSIQQSEQDTQRFDAAGLKLISNYTLGPKSKLLVGFDANTEGLTGERIESGLQRNDELALYSSFERKIAKAKVRLGVRKGMMNSDFTPWIFAVQSRIPLRRNLFLRLSYGQAYRVPSIKERYLSFFDSNHAVYGNPDLLAESGQSLQARLNQLFKIGSTENSLDLAAFYNFVNNKIELLSLSPLEGTYRNIGNFQSQGLTVTHSLEYKAFDIKTTYNLIGTDLGDGYQYSTRLSNQISYEISKTNTVLTAFSSSFFNNLMSLYDPETDEIERIQQKPYALMDLQVAQPILDKRIRIGCGARNILNVTQAVQDGGSGIHSGGGLNFISNGRVFYVNLNVDISK